MEIHCEQGSLLLNDNTLWRVTPGERVRLTCDDSRTVRSKLLGLGHQQAIRRFIRLSLTPVTRITPISMKPGNHSPLWSYLSIISIKAMDRNQLIERNLYSSSK